MYVCYKLSSMRVIFLEIRYLVGEVPMAVMVIGDISRLISL